MHDPIRLPRVSPAFVAGPAAAALLMAGCGSPPPQQAAGGDFPVPVVAATVERRALEERLSLVGSVQAPEEVRLVSETDGRITEIGFEEGSPVGAGAVLFRIDDRKQLAKLEEARARLDLAESNLRRGEDLLREKTIPPQEFDRLQTEVRIAEAAVEGFAAELEDTVVRAPFAGVAGERSVSLGQVVTRGVPLAELLQADPAEVSFSVPERHAARLEVGGTMILKTVAHPGEPFEGIIGYVAPSLDRASRTLDVKARIPNPDGRLRPGMFGTVELVFRVRDDALVVPEACLVHQGERTLVLVIDADRMIAFQPVETGVRLEGSVEILDGLSAGQLVVVEGVQKVGPGSRVSLSPESSRFGVSPDPAPGDSGAAGPGPEGAAGAEAP